MALSFPPSFRKKKKVFANFLRTQTTKEERKNNLRHKIMEYILERAKIKNITHLPKRLISRIENEAENILDEAIENNLEEFKKVEIEEIMENRTNSDFVHFDRYEIIEEDPDTIEILKKELPDEEFIHFDRYEIREEDENEK